jgi:ATP-binding protein involved in chromosome partitioning
MVLTEQQVREALQRIPYPGFSRNIVAAGVVRELRVEAGHVHVALDLREAGADAAASVERAVVDSVRALDGVTELSLDMGTAAPPASALNVIQEGRPAPAPSRAPDLQKSPGVDRIVAVASGKGGVGKSTVAVNLAVALARRGNAVGLLDADIYGPSIPLMMGARDRRPGVDPTKQLLIPLERFGVRFMSLGFLLPDPDAAVIWRGPMVMKALEQLLIEVDWSGLDVLVVDLPPGTGDAQLTLSQRVRLSGAVIVTTPQDVALADAVKGVAMFRKVGVPVLGLVENMSYFQCPHCSERTDVFGHGGGRDRAAKLEVPFLGEIPLDGAIRSSGDAGEPVAAAPDGQPSGQAFLKLADAVAGALRAGQAATGGPAWGRAADPREV